MVVPLPENLRTGTDSSSDLENINTNNRFGKMGLFLYLYLNLYTKNIMTALYVLIPI